MHMENTENPYSAPQSAVTSGRSVIDDEKRKMFSPTQGAMSAFFFGPFAGLYIVQNNFASMSEYARRQQSITYGVILIAAFLFITPFIPDFVPGVLFGLIYMLPTRAGIEKFQLSKAQILESEHYRFHSNWRVFGIGILGILAYLVCLIIVFIAYSALAWIEPLW